MVAQRVDYAAAVAVAVGRIVSLRGSDPWAATRRPAQVPPAGDWRTWAVLSGRGWGKTRTAAEWVREEVMAGRARRVALVGATAADVRDTMVEGESGLMAVCDRYAFRPRYEPSKRRVTFPNGAIATTYSADEPDRLRGPQHDLASCDEVAAWRRPEAWSNLQFGLRLGSNPRQIVTTTPRPIKHIREIVADPTTVVTRGHTDDNLANLAPAYREIIEKYRGTRLGRQELAGELLDDVVGALWSSDRIERDRLPADAAQRGLLPVFTRVVVATDPQAGYDAEGEGSETGIVVMARDARGHGYVLADLSGNYTPAEWGAKNVEARRAFGADRHVAEANQGGRMVEHTIRTVDPSAPIRLVHASRGKIARAEPVSALSEQGRLHHVGAFPDLEDQMTTFVPDQSAKSPDRLDAMVWAATDLLLGAPPPTVIRSY